MRLVRVGRDDFVQDMNRDLIKVNRDIHESKRVNVMFDILYVFCNSSITLLKTGKILAMDHDLSTRGRGICLLEGDSRSPRCGGRGEKRHKRWSDGSDNCIKKKLILLDLDSIIRIWGGRSSIRQSYHS